MELRNAFLERNRQSSITVDLDRHHFYDRNRERRDQINLARVGVKDRCGDAPNGDTYTSEFARKSAIRAGSSSDRIS